MATNDTATTVRLTCTDGIARLHFDRPQSMNAMDMATAKAFLAGCQAIAADDSVRVVVLSGEGRGFGAGGDLAALRELGPDGTADLIDHMNQGVRILASLESPVLASLHGLVAGGSLSLAINCDLAIAAEGTRFNMAYANVAACCDVGGSWALPRIVGLRRAMELALLSETFDAAEALRLGLVNRVVPADRLGEETQALAHRLAQGPRFSLGRIKRQMRASLDNDLDTQLDLEREFFRACARTEDFREALDAFQAKRKPVFRGA